MPTKVQSSGKVQANNALSISKSFASLPAAGSFIFVDVHRYGDVSAGALTDNQGNTYTLAVEDASGSTQGCAVYYCANIPAPSGTFTITYTFPAVSNGWLVAEEWSGMGAATVLATTAAAGSTNTMSTGTTSSVTPGVNGALVVATSSVVISPDAAPVVETVSPAWVEVGQETGWYPHPIGISHARVVTAAGTQACSWTQPAAQTGNWGTALVVFAPSPLVTTGSFVAGQDGTVTSSRTALFNLDGVDRTGGSPSSAVDAEGSLVVGGNLMLIEQATAPTGIANSARLFTEDNGSGKTRLMVQFGTGTPIQISIEA